jgi:hypothetical protein
VLVDQKESGAHAAVPQRIEERRRPVWIRTVVEREIDRRWRPGLRLDLPQRPGRPERFEEERKRSGMCQRGGAEDRGDDHEHTRSYQIILESAWSLAAGRVFGLRYPGLELLPWSLHERTNPDYLQIEWTATKCGG